MGYFAVTTVTSATPTAASGSVSFTVADPSSLPAVPFSAWHYPQLRNDSSGVTRAKQAQKIDVTAVSGATVTATLGSDTTGRAISFGDVIDVTAFVLPGALRLGTGTLPTFVDPTPPLRLDIGHGSSAAPITGLGPSVRIYRTEAIPFATQANPAYNATNAALAVYSNGKQGSDQQATGLWAMSYSEQLSVHGAAGYSDACALLGIGWSEHGFGIGGYLEGRTGFVSQVGFAVGAEIRVTNYRGANYSYGGVGAPELIGLWVDSYANGGAYRSGVGVAFASVDNQAIWDKGIAFIPGSVYDVSIVDYSSSLTSLDIRGSHVNGIDTSNGTFSSWAGSFVSAQVAQLFVSPAGANDSGIVLNAAASHSANLYFEKGLAGKFLIQLDASNNLLVFDEVNLTIPFEISAAGATLLGASGKGLGFYGHAAINLQTGVAVSAAGIHAALVALGLITA